MASQAIHSTTDFGLHIPSNAAWFAVLSGSLVGCATQNRRVGSDGMSRSASSRFATALVPAGAAGLLLLAVLGALDARNSIASASASRACRLFQKEARRAGASLAQKVERTIAELAQALPSAWSDAEIHEGLADLYMTRYRLEAGEAWDDPPADLPESNAANSPGARQADQPGDVTEIRSVQDPLLLSARLQQVPEEQREAARRALEASPAVQRSLVPAVRHALLAREFCLLLPRVEMRLAELSFLFRSCDSDAVYLDRARLLAGPDAPLWFGAGLLDWYADRPDAAYASWRRSLELSDRYLEPILAWSTSRLAPAEIPTKVLPEKPAVLLAAAEYLYPFDDALAERRPLFEKALQLLADQPGPLTGEELYVKVQLLRRLGQQELALAACHAALAEHPRQVDCRFELADLLREKGQLQQSLWQLQLVLDQSPAHEGARTLSQFVRRRIAEEGERPEQTRQMSPRQ